MSTKLWGPTVNIYMRLDFFDLFYYCSLIASASIGLACFKKLEPPFRWIAVLLVITVISELIAKFIAIGLGKPNNIVYHFFTPLEYGIYVIIFLHFLGHPQWKLPLLLSIAGLILLEIVNTIYFQPLTVMNTNTIIMENLLLVFLSLWLFIRIREAPFRQELHLEGVFWFNSAVLCYYAYNILISGLQSMKVYLLDNPPLIIYDFNKILSGLLYITYLVAIFLSASKRKQIQLQHD